MPALIEPDEGIVDATAALVDVNDVHPEVAVPIITVMVRAYTRGNGFTGSTPNDELAAVIATAAARLAGNGRQLATDTSAGEFTQSLRNAFSGWSLAELAVLNRYRVRAM
jgi:hypothetical protein